MIHSELTGGFRHSHGDPESGSATDDNGVLEVVFDRVEDATDIDVE